MLNSQLTNYHAISSLIIAARRASMLRPVMATLVLFTSRFKNANTNSYAALIFTVLNKSSRPAVNVFIVLESIRVISTVCVTVPSVYLGHFVSSVTLSDWLGTASLKLPILCQFSSISQVVDAALTFTFDPVAEFCLYADVMLVRSLCYVCHTIL